MDFTFQADHTIKFKENEKKDKHLDLASEIKQKLWNVKLTAIPIVIGAISAVTEGLLQRQEDLETRAWVETIQTITSSRWARILRTVLETWEDLLSFKLEWKTIG